MSSQEIVLAVVCLEDRDCSSIALSRDYGTVCTALILLSFEFANIFEQSDVLNTLSAGEHLIYNVSMRTVSRLSSDFSSRRARTTKGLRAAIMLVRYDLGLVSRYQ